MNAPLPLRLLSATLAAALAAGLGYVVLSLPPEAPRLSGAVATHLNDSGVSNPVTAVLLNFRGYDTLLELVVLFAALLGVWAPVRALPAAPAMPPPVLDTLTRLLVPTSLLVAVYLLWAGAHAPGGAFQAGALLGATGVLLRLSGRHPIGTRLSPGLRFVLILGPAAFVMMAVATYLLQGELLRYPVAQAGLLILLLELAATISIGATLTALFLGGAPGEEEPP